jgi:hypothetical protein
MDSDQNQRTEPDKTIAMSDRVPARFLVFFLSRPIGIGMQ